MSGAAFPGYAWCRDCGVNPVSAYGLRCSFCQADEDFENCEFCHGTECTNECIDEDEFS